MTNQIEDLNEDKRPDPKPRKRMQLWQLYLQLDELEEMRKRHNLRISSAERGKSNMDVELERAFIQSMNLDLMIEGGTVRDESNKIVRRIPGLRKDLAKMAEVSAPAIWAWITSLRGLGAGKMAAQLIAQVDDIGSFDTVSKLWRFAGMAVIDGKSERNVRGEKSHYNRRLKSLVWLISDEFVKMQTSPYAQIYYAEKSRLRALHPDKEPNPDHKAGARGWPYLYTDQHIDRMAKRKMAKIFLQHLWLTWRQAEGLPVSDPYVKAVLGHTHIIEPTEEGDTP